MSFVSVSVFFSFFHFLVKYFQLCIVTSLLPFVANKAYQLQEKDVIKIFFYI